MGWTATTPSMQVTNRGCRKSRLRERAAHTTRYNCRPGYREVNSPAIRDRDRGPGCRSPQPATWRCTRGLWPVGTASDRHGILCNGPRLGLPTNGNRTSCPSNASSLGEASCEAATVRDPICVDDLRGITRPTMGLLPARRATEILHAAQVA